MTAVARIPVHGQVIGEGFARRIGQSNTSGVNNVKNLVDHGGPIIPAANLYAIFWGPASGFPADEQSHVTSFLQGFGSSDYLQIAKQYMRGAALTATFQRAFFDPSPPAKKPNTATIAAEIQSVLAANNATPDVNGVYVVLTTNFPTGVSYCAWHDGVTINGTAIAEAYIPNPPDSFARCATPAAFDGSGSSAATRSIVDSAAHELMESITDKTPNGNTLAWIDNGGGEIADKCVVAYGGPVSVGGTNWEVQEEWSNAVSGCVQYSHP
jgi:hypothetical protein